MKPHWNTLHVWLNNAQKPIKLLNHISLSFLTLLFFNSRSFEGIHTFIPSLLFIATKKTSMHYGIWGLHSPKESFLRFNIRRVILLPLKALPAIAVREVESITSNSIVRKVKGNCFTHHCWNFMHISNLKQRNISAKNYLFLLTKQLT